MVQRALSRRVLIGTAATILVAPPVALAQPQIPPAPRPPASPVPAVRRRLNVAGMAPNDPALASYRRAVVAMRALPSSDARNWENQARIHLNHCPHGNWYFLPWHRAYLLAFERICQTLSGDATFRLPYWNWTVDRVIPAALTVATVDGQPNPLRHTRGPNAGAALPDSIVGTDVIEDILDEPTFTTFASAKPTGQDSTATTWQRAPGAYGPLEGTPHNSVHGRIGGDMGTFLSPRDPIFWLHHCNVDRLWDAWRRRGNADSTDPHWADFRFTGQFVLGNGTTRYEPRCRDLSNVRTLGYEYVPQLIVRPPLTDRLVALGTLRPLGAMPQAVTAAPAAASPGAVAATPSDQAQGNVLTFRVSLPPAALAAVQRDARPPAAAAPGPAGRDGGRGGGGPDAAADPVSVSQGRVLARIAAAPPGNEQGVSVRVFLGLPTADAATATSDPHFVGVFSFFDDPAAHRGHDAAAAEAAGSPPFLLDVTRTVQRLARAGRPVGAETQIVLVPVLPGGAPPAVTVRELTLVAG